MRPFIKKWLRAKFKVLLGMTFADPEVDPNSMIPDVEEEAAPADGDVSWLQKPEAKKQIKDFDKFVQDNFPTDSMTDVQTCHPAFTKMQGALVAKIRNGEWVKIVVPADSPDAACITGNCIAEVIRMVDGIMPGCGMQAARFVLDGKTPPASVKMDMFNMEEKDITHILGLRALYTIGLFQKLASSWPQAEDQNVPDGTHDMMKLHHGHLSDLFPLLQAQIGEVDSSERCDCLETRVAMWQQLIRQEMELLHASMVSVKDSQYWEMLARGMRSRLGNVKLCELRLEAEKHLSAGTLQIPPSLDAEQVLADVTKPVSKYLDKNKFIDLLVASRMKCRKDQDKAKACEFESKVVEAFTRLREGQVPDEAVLKGVNEMLEQASEPLCKLFKLIPEVQRAEAKKARVLAAEVSFKLQLWLHEQDPSGMGVINPEAIMIKSNPKRPRDNMIMLDPTAPEPHSVRFYFVGQCVPLLSDGQSLKGQHFPCFTQGGYTFHMVPCMNNDQMETFSAMPAWCVKAQKTKKRRRTRMQ